MESTVFLSHARPQSPMAWAIDRWLTNQGYKGILYERDFDQNENFVDQITEALVNTWCTVSLISSDYVSSNWCTREFQVAYDSRRLIPVLIEDSDYSNLPPFTEFIDIRGMTQTEAIGVLEKTLPEWLKKLNPKPLSRKKVHAFIDQISIILPLFGQDKQATTWQHHALRTLNKLLKDFKNVSPLGHPDNATTEQEAEKLLKRYNGDIAVYGSFYGSYTIIGFVNSRGWDTRMHYHDKERTGKLESKIFMVQGEDFNDLFAILLIAFANLAKAKHQQELAQQYMLKALAMYTEAIRWKSKNSYHRRRGDIYAHLGQHDEAITDLTKAIDLEPKDIAAYNNRGQVFAAQGRYNEAIADFTEAIRLDPSYVVAHDSRGFAYGQLGQYDKALADYTEAIRLDPKESHSYCGRGEIYRQMHRHKKAVEDFTKSIKLDPMYAKAYAYRGTLYVKLSRYNEALIDFNDSIRLDPTDASVYFNRGGAYNLLYRYKEALTDLEKYFSLTPNDRSVLPIMANLKAKVGNS